MKRLKLKRWVKVTIVVIIGGLLIINFCKNFNNVTTDDFGNTCQGGIIKICHN